MSAIRFLPRRRVFCVVLLCVISVYVLLFSPLSVINIDALNLSTSRPVQLSAKFRPDLQTWQDCPPILVAVTSKPQQMIFDAWSGMNARLKQKLLEFAARPLLDFEEAKAQNSVPCPTELRDITTNHEVWSNRNSWSAATTDHLRGLRQRMLNFIGSLQVDITDTSAVKGKRGVVITAGNQNTAARAVVLIRRMRKLGYTGDIEVFHFPGELSPNENTQAMEDLGAVLRIVSANKQSDWKSFNIKSVAIIESSFDEVLYLDCDNLPISDITPLFDSPIFQNERGGRAVLWHDFNRDHTYMPAHRLLGVECYDTWQTESGQLLYAKSGNGGLNLAALHIAAHMANSGDYWFSGGDKDTFRYALLVLGLTYTPAPRAAASVGYIRSNGDFCGLITLQYSTIPGDIKSSYRDEKEAEHEPPMFMHVNLVKYHTTPKNTKVFNKIKRIPSEWDTARYPTSKFGNHLDAGTLDWDASFGICVDLYTKGIDEQMVVEDLDKVFGGLLANFEDEYFADGGIVS